MLQTVYQRFSKGCMMLFRKEGEEVTFVGTAFVIHPEGYLMTAAHILYSDSNLMVAPWDFSNEFVPVSTRSVTPIGIKVIRVDLERDLALLKFKDEMKIGTPDHVIGLPEEVPVGSTVGSLGFSFGFYHLFNLIARQAVVSAKISSRNGTQCLLFDTRVHEGQRGGPLVNIADGRIIGVIGGTFNPQEASLAESSATPLPQTSISYAVSIDYASVILKEDGLEVI